MQQLEREGGRVGRAQSEAGRLNQEIGVGKPACKLFDIIDPGGFDQQLRIAAAEPFGEFLRLCKRPVRQPDRPRAASGADSGGGG